MSFQSSYEHRSHHPKKLLQQIERSDWFHPLVTQVKQLARLQALFEKVMGGSAQEYRVVELTNGCLFLQTANSAWLARLRYQTPAMIKQLQKIPEFSTVTHIRGHIQPLTSTRPSSAPPNPLSLASAECIAKMAATIQDPLLKNALLKLATVTK